MSLRDIWKEVKDRFQSPSTGAVELAEIRHDVLDRVRDNIQELSANRFLFPFNRILVELRPRTPAERAAIQAVWIDRSDLRNDLLTALKRAECEYSSELRVDVCFRATPHPSNPAGRFWVTFDNLRASEASTHQPAAGPTLRISVKTGSATPSSLDLFAEITNIGRLEEVIDRDGQFIRRNDVVFEDVRNGVNETVSRTHAQIRRQDDGRFVLLNTPRSGTNPTVILRDGRPITVILLAEQIRHGDVIVLGKARISVTDKASSAGT